MEKVEKIVVEKSKLLKDNTLAEFSEALASGAPTPGGGAAAAYTAALGVSCGLMVCNLTLGREKYADVQAEIEELKKDLEAMRGYLVRQVDEDAMAYQPLKKYLALSPDAPERSDHLEAALRVACQVPTEVMYTAGRALELLETLAAKGSRAAISDVGVGAELSRAALMSAQQCILINAAAMKDDVFAMTLRIECEKVQAQYLPMAQRITTAVSARLK